MDTKERQDEEIAALQSIFADDFKFVKPATPWKNVNAPIEFVIHVRPLDISLRNEVCINLHVRLPKTYPRAGVLPVFTLEDVKGLHANKLPSLQQLLKQTAQELKGSETIFELTSVVSSYLSEHHAGSRPAENTSLIEELGKRAEAARQAEIARSSAVEAEQEQLRRQEREELARLIESDRQIQLDNIKEHQNHSDAVDDHVRFPLVHHDDIWQLSLPDGPANCTLQIGSVVRELAIGALSSVQIQPENAGQRLSASLISLDFTKAKSYYSSSSGQRKLAQVQDDLNRLEKLSSPSLIRPFGSKLSSSRSGFPPLRLDILLSPFASTLEEMLQMSGEMQPDKVVEVLKDTLSALLQLHNSGMTHKRLTLQSVVFLPGQFRVKVFGSSYLQRLFDMNRSVPFCSASPRSVEPEAWQCPETLYDPLAYDKARDIWDLGVCAVKLVFGVDALVKFSGPDQALQSVVHPILHRCLSAIFVPAKQRLSAAQLLQLADSLDDRQTPIAIKSPEATSSSLGLIPPTPLQDTHFQPGTSPDRSSALFYQPQRQTQAPASRYRSEFEEVEFLGKGGFGSVVKAVNKLDKNYYAIKRIKMPSDLSSEQKILREVTTWSRLSHPAIVRYHTAWVESETQSLDADKALMEIETSQSDTPTQDVQTDSFEDFSMGLSFDDDNDFLSKNGEANSSYPQIHFGSSSGDGSGSDTEESQSRQLAVPLQPIRSRKTSLVRQQKRTLYIQMEFVDGKTLREAIDAGIKEDEAWKLLRQILQAIASFTSLGIVHRDLKPGNIFLDALGHVKVGDFGLAVEAALNDMANSQERAKASIESDMTSGVGTGLYLPPESLKRSSTHLGRHYEADKIDMYSLGICFFEMIFPFKTRMERIKILQALRQPEIHFPESWDAQRHSNEQKTIRWLLQYNPSDRPSASELLKSDLLPAAVVDEVIEEAVRQIAQPKSPHRFAALSTLFHPSARDRLTQDFLYDYTNSTIIEPYNVMATDELRFLFKRRGAVELDTPFLMPASSLYDVNEGRRPVKLLDESGTVTQLPYDLIVPLCRQVARDPQLGRLKRFSIGPVFRRREPGGGQPRAFPAASFEIVSSVKTLAAEAECIHVVDEALDEFPLLGSQYIHQVGHMGLLKSILSDLQPDIRKAVLRSLETLTNKGDLASSSKVTLELQKTDIDKRVLDKLISLSFFSNVQDLLKQSSGHIRFSAALQELEEIRSLCTELGVKRNILICPLLVVNGHLHEGEIDVAFFQTVYRSKTGLATLAVGGRYDNVVAKFAQPDRETLVHVAGVSFAMAQLARSMAEEQEASVKALAAATQGTEKSFGRYPTRRCDVYVVSFSQGLLRARLSLCALLWKNNIKADLMYDDDRETRSIEQMATTRKREGILFLVIVKHSQISYKVRNILRTGEAEVPRTELVAYLTENIADQARVDMQLSSDRQGKEVNALAYSTPIKLAEQRSLASTGEVHLLTSETGKKQLARTRNLIAGKAEAAIASRIDALRDAPIFAIEIAGDAFFALSDSRWVHDPEIYSRVSSLLSPNKKQLLSTLRMSLRDFVKSHDHRPLQAWLYTVNQQGSILLTFE